MIQIIKCKEPRSLTEYRMNKDATYNNLPTNVRQDIRECLLKEQGCLCAYCMRRISADNIKIGYYSHLRSIILKVLRFLGYFIYMNDFLNKKGYFPLWLHLAHSTLF